MTEKRSKDEPQDPELRLVTDSNENADAEPRIRLETSVRAEAGRMVARLGINEADLRAYVQELADRGLLREDDQEPSVKPPTKVRPLFGGDNNAPRSLHHLLLDLGVLGVSRERQEAGVVRAMREGVLAAVDRRTLRSAGWRLDRRNQRATAPGTAEDPTLEEVFRGLGASNESPEERTGVLRRAVFNKDLYPSEIRVLDRANWLPLVVGTPNCLLPEGQQFRKRPFDRKESASEILERLGLTKAPWIYQLRVLRASARGECFTAEEIETLRDAGWPIPLRVIGNPDLW
jgi:hypothetical protein